MALSKSDDRAPNQGVPLRGTWTVIFPALHALAFGDWTAFSWWALASLAGFLLELVANDPPYWMWPTHWMTRRSR
jgi:hypothetical protein